MLTAAKIQTYIEHALRGSVSTDLAILDIVNQAGDFVYTVHPWRWRESRTGTVDTRGAIGITGATWTEAGYILKKTGAFSTYTHLRGDTIAISSGTNATVGTYKLASKIDNDNVALETSIGSAANGQTNIAGTMSLDSCSLPDDFGELVPARGVRGRIISGVTGLQLVTIQDLLDMRANIAIWNTSGYFGAIGNGFTNLLPSISILELYPVPQQSIAGAFLINYRAKFAYVTNDSTVLRIPEWMDDYFIQVAREMALGYEEHDNLSMTTRLSALTMDVDPKTGGKTLFYLKKQQDGSAQQSFSKPRAPGAMRRGQWSIDMALSPFSSINPPSSS